MEKHLGQTLINGKGEQVPVASICGPNKTVALYFSAHWCPPCRGFTPKLADFYNKFKTSAKGDQLEIVFVSFDRDEGSFKSYFASMPWLSLPYDEEDMRQSLGSTFGVSGIPALILLNSETGEVITKNGREKVGSDPNGDNFPWAN